MKKFLVLATIVLLGLWFWQFPTQAKGWRWSRLVLDSSSRYLYEELLYEPDQETSNEIMVVGLNTSPNLGAIGVENYREDYAIPASIDGKTVIGFSGNRDFQRANTFILSEGIREIGYEAFYVNDNFTLVLPDSIASINDNAFSSYENVTFYCHQNSFAEQYAISKGIKCITYKQGKELPILYDYEILSDGTISISRYKNKNMEGTIIVPEEIDGYKVTEIAPLTFLSCENCTSIVIPDGIKKIGANAFFCCDKLETISIPDSVVEIDPYAFDQNPGVLSTLPGRVSIRCSSKSYAKKYARKENLNYITTN